MFRQTIILVSLIAGAAAATYFTIGTRVDGDQNIYNQTSQSFETVLPTTHTVNMFFLGGENTFTFSRFDVYEGLDAGISTDVDDKNGFNVTVTNYNTRHLTVTATIYGLPPGKAPVKFVEPKN